MVEVLEKATCYHCGEDCKDEVIEVDDKVFCCLGCHTVFDILKSNDMEDYYFMEKSPGSRRRPNNNNQWAYLDLEEVKKFLIKFTDGSISKATFYIPAIHCSSCIWLLENLHKLDSSIRTSMVNFSKKEVSINWSEDKISIRNVVELLANLGYEPDISLQKNTQKKHTKNKTSYIKIGIAGFCFGNIMMLSLPEYLDSKNLVEENYRIFFTYLNLLLVLPVVFYSASDFYKSAWNGLKYKYLNLDLTIAIGILVIFGRSAYEMITHIGAGYMDSLSGLVFFLLIGKWYQSKTYEALGFERDYNSYFPVAATRIKDGREETVLLKDLHAGDRILIRNQELIPADAILIKGEGKIDYAFVTGESEPIEKISGDFMYAGGRQTGGMLEIEIQKPVESSYLTQLWNQEAFRKDNPHKLSALVQNLSRRFTFLIILLSVITAMCWFFIDPSKIWNTVTAVLIVACPCALALVIPFSFGNTLRILGRWGLYLKSAEAVEALATIDTLVFDKTGTITHNNKGRVHYIGSLEKTSFSIIKSLVRNSTHPLSQAIYVSLKDEPMVRVKDFKEIAGSGVSGIIDGHHYTIGSAEFVGASSSDNTHGATRVYFSQDKNVLGYYEFSAEYREGLDELLKNLKQEKYALHLLSGDNDRDKNRLKGYFDQLHFNQHPVDKLEYIRSLKEEGKNVLMVGDGLNDAGAIKESQLGISVSDDVYHFSPACDVIMDAKSFDKILDSIKLAKGSMRVIQIAFILSFLYNIIGLGFAVTAQLSPIVCAILMPLSSVTIVGFVTVAIRYYAQTLDKPSIRKQKMNTIINPIFQKVA